MCTDTNQPTKSEMPSLIHSKDMTGAPTTENGLSDSDSAPFGVFCYP